MTASPVRRLADRVAAVPPFRVVQVLERARALERQGRHVVHLEVGEPDFPSAPSIVKAAAAASEAGHTGYTEALGLPALREAIAASYGLDIDPRRVAVTTGASGALNLLAQVLVNPGDEVLLADPGYPCNGVFVRAAGGIPRAVAVDRQTRFQLTPGRLAEAWSGRTAGALLASPANPTGSMLAADEVAAIAAFARQRGFLVVDEIYQGLVYDGAPGRWSSLAVDDGLFVVNSFSKYYGMTGWRIGWLVAPLWAMDAIERCAQNLYIAPPTVSQHAALAALQPAAVAVHEQRRGVFARRRNVLLDGLDRLGLAVAHRPEGAFYVYVDIASLGVDGETFCSRLIEDHGVAATPGTDFGAHRSADHVRFTFTSDEAEIRTGLDRIGAALARLRSQPAARQPA